MKSACVFLVCLTAYVQSHGGRRVETFREIIKSQRTKESTMTNSGGEYSPVYVGSQDGLKEADKITEIPGQPEVSFSQYSGYVTVDPNAGRALFYYFTECTDPLTSPLVLWLNGGPGCSSIGGGAMTELGPFRVNPDGKTLWHNQNAWNKIANVIFLESPAGVGFSYSNTSSDYTTGDGKTAADAYTFLVNWLERFPEYKTRDLFITGESYAGHYVPQLAALILKNNQTHVINLKGIAIGNPYIDADDNLRGTFDYYWMHSLISDDTHQGIVQNCNFSWGGPVSQACYKHSSRAYVEIGNIDAYNIYAPLCNYSAPAAPASGFDPCSDEYVYTYLNTPAVQKALHANVTGIPGPWFSCGYNVHYNSKDIMATVIPTLQGLMATHISVWIYSGDTDANCPVTATKYSLEKIGAPVKTPWYPWYFQDEVGGYMVEYQNLTFVTVRGSGHFVPSNQPERALAMFASFLDGKLPPSHA